MNVLQGLNRPTDATGLFRSMPATTGATRHSSRSLIASIAPTLVPSATLAPQCEHMFSALPLRADIAGQSRHVRFVPTRDSCIAARSFLFDHLVGADE